MCLKVILFDLDGTLLPMNQEKFVKNYFSLLAKKMSLYGYDPIKIIDSVWAGTNAMIKNDGQNTNEFVFWELFKQIYGKEVLNDYDKFEQFYENEFQLVKNVCGYNKQSNEIIKHLKDLNYKLILATNPIFPSIATESRIRWAGLDINDFIYVSTYENSKYCKPNLNYYLEILNKNNIKVENCLMVGNDVEEDMVVEKIGMKVFLLTNDLINKNNININKYPNGGFDELKIYIDKIKNSEL